MRSIEEYIPNDYCLYENDATFPEKGLRGLNWKGRIKFRGILFMNNLKLEFIYKQAIEKRECYVGPFWGEFGNFLLHFLPFVMHLYQNGIKVNVICLEHYRPFFTNSEGKFICNEFYPLKKTQTEFPPSGNYLKVIPQGFNEIHRKVVLESKNRRIPFFDLSDSDFYWYSFRNWELSEKQAFLNLRHVKEKSNKVVLFPRAKGPAYTLNNGERLDYVELSGILSEYFQEVIVVGLPEMSANAEFDNPKIVNRVGDNETVLKECAEARLIVSQHSGAIHVGLYTNTPSLIIYKGVLPIKGLDDTLRFRKNAFDPGLYLATSNWMVHDFLNVLQTTF